MRTRSTPTAHSPGRRPARLAFTALLGVLWACASPGGAEVAPKAPADSGGAAGDGGGADAEDSAGVVDPTEAPLLSPDQISTAGAAALGALYESDPRALQRVYEGVLAEGDGACPPYSGAYAGQRYWEGDCAAASGAAYEGWALSAWAEGFTSSAEGLRYDALAWYYGMARVRSAAGETLEAWGNNDLRVWSTLDGRQFGVHAAMGGSFDWGGAGPDFLHAGADHGWSIDLERRSDGSRSLVASGGIGLLQGVFDAFAFDAVSAEVPPGGCLDEPLGRVHLREAATGRWYDLDFDPTVCDGCGAVTVRTAAGEEAIGEACLPWAPLLRWEVDPWTG
jgi:hypothetical protein